MRRGRLLDAGRQARTSIARSRTQESRAASSIGGHTVTGSGNQWHSKGDVTSNDWLVECKTTEARSFKLTRTVLDKAQLEAMRAGKRSVVMLTIDGEDFAVIPWAEFMNCAGTP